MPIPDSRLLSCPLPSPQKPSGPCRAEHHRRATPAGCSVRSCAAPAYSSLAASSVPLASDGLPLPSLVTNFAWTRPRLAIAWVEQAVGPWVGPWVGSWAGSWVDRGEAGRAPD